MSEYEASLRVEVAPQTLFSVASDPQRRVEWGSRGDGSYAGWLQAYATGTGPDECEVVIHLARSGADAASLAVTGTVVDQGEWDNRDTHHPWNPRHDQAVP